MIFFAFAAGLVSKLVVSIGSRSLGDKLKDVKTQRRMARMVEDAVDRIVEQVEEYLRAEKLSDARKEILIASLCAKLQPLADDPQRFFAGNLDGAVIFKQCHPNGELPQEIREEDLGQFYSVLFPQIAHFLAGSRIALAQWQAEGFREEFKRLSQLAEEIRAMNAKVAELPVAVVGALTDKAAQEMERLLREFAQTLLNNLLLRLDLSPLRAERSLYGALGDHFVIPAFRERREKAEQIGNEQGILNALTAPGAHRIVHGGAGVGKTSTSRATARSGGLGLPSQPGGCDCATTARRAGRMAEIISRRTCVDSLVASLSCGCGARVRRVNWPSALGVARGAAR